MNLAFNLLFLLSICFSFRSIAYASECAILSFKNNHLDKGSYITLIIGNNGQFVNNRKNVKSLISGDHEYKLAEGSHTLIIEQWTTSDYKKLTRKNYINEKYNITKPHQIKTIHLNVTANKKYQLLFDSNKSKVTIGEETSTSCDSNSNKLLKARVATNSEVFIDDFDLPVSLAYRLRRTMREISGYHEKKQSSYGYSNIIPLELNDYFGTVLDKKSYLNKPTFRVLSVLPYSLASQLGLASGDEIIALGNISIEDTGKHPNIVLREYFSSLKINSSMSFEIVRDGKVLILKGRYTPIIVPEYQYQVSSNLIALDKQNLLAPSVLTNSSEIPEDLKFEFKQLILAISSFFQGKEDNVDLVTLKSVARPDKRFGLVGRSFVDETVYGFKVSSIDLGSPADSLGLQKGDIVVNTAEEIAGVFNFLLFSEYLESLESGQEYSLTVKRGKQIKVLINEYHPVILPSFSVTLDLASINSAKERLSDANNLASPFSDSHEIYIRLNKRPTFKSVPKNTSGNTTTVSDKSKQSNIQN